MKDLASVEEAVRMGAEMYQGDHEWLDLGLDSHKT